MKNFELSARHGELHIPVYLRIVHFLSHGPNSVLAMAYYRPSAHGGQYAALVARLWAASMFRARVSHASVVKGARKGNKRCAATELHL